MKKRWIFVMLLSGASNFIFAQGIQKDTSVAVDNAPTDGFLKNDAYKGAKPMPLPKVNMNNVRFFKRVYRDIDLQDPKNNALTIPGATLIETILDGIKEGKLTAYEPGSSKNNPTGDAFTVPMKPEDAMKALVDSVLVPTFDNEGNQVAAVMQLNDFNPASITKFRVKEDIFYDNQRSRIETRVVGLAPLKTIAAGGETIPEQPAFWLNYPQCRMVFVTKEVVDPQKNIAVSFDDIFLQHSFVSKIVKEANPTDDKEPNPAVIEDQIAKYKKNTWKY